MLCAPINSFIKLIWYLFICMEALKKAASVSKMYWRNILRPFFFFHNSIHLISIRLTWYEIKSSIVILNFTLKWNEKGNITCIVLSTSGQYCWKHRCNLFLPLLHIQYTCLCYSTLILFLFLILYRI